MTSNAKTIFTKDRPCPKCGSIEIDVSLFQPRLGGGFVRIRCMSCLHTVAGWGNEMTALVHKFSTQWELGIGGLEETRFSTTNPRFIKR